MVEQTGRKARGRQPISRHRLFPATVGLWAAALSTLVSLSIKPAVLPALGVAAICGVLGLIIARRIASPKMPADENSPAPEGETEQEKLSGESEEDRNPLWSELRGRHQALIEHQDEPVLAAPSPPPFFDRDPQFLELESVEVDADGPGSGGLAVEQPTTMDDHGPSEAPGMLASLEVIVADAAEDADDADARDESANPSETAAERIAHAELDQLSHVELLERLALSLQRRGARVIGAGAALTVDAPASGDPGAAGAADPVEPSVVFPDRAVRRNPALTPTATGNPAPPSSDLSDAGQPSEAPETELALRAALETLQRMSGAA